MAIDQHASNLIDITVKAFNGTSSSVSPTDGISLIDSWISFLQSNSQRTDSQGSDALLADLNELKTALQEGNLDSTRIQDVVSNLTDQTKQMTDAADEDSKPRLNTLAEGLQGFNQQFSSPTQRDDSGKQAPMTSTVGGESTTSGGAGVSALGASDDDLSNRNGGTLSVDMDDTTGSDGGTTKARSSEETGDSGSSSTGNGDNSSATQRSRSDTARLDGMGVSGGSGDSDYSQSGGRSQY